MMKTLQSHNAKKSGIKYPIYLKDSWETIKNTIEPLDTLNNPKENSGTPKNPNEFQGTKIILRNLAHHKQ